MDTVVKGHAKINWKLEVLGPFPDQHPNAGFTELRSVISLIELHDRVRIQCERDESGSVRIHSNHPDVPQTANQRAEHNVCFKAIQALRKHFPELWNYAFEIQIEKN